MPTDQTPLFDEALARSYEKDDGSTPRICTETGLGFTIPSYERSLFRSLRIPFPTVAPYVRLRRLRASVAGLDLFRRTQPDGTSLISMYDPESPVSILPEPVWHSDAFDPMSYGRAYDLTKSFFRQWEALSRVTPRPSVIQDPASENSPWVLYGDSLKNCYFTYQGMHNEDTQYSDFCVGVKTSADLLTSYHSNQCYESVQLDKCARTSFSERCEECLDVIFCLGCRSCQDCFGCSNLRQKKYCFLNEQLSEEEYRKRMQTIDLQNADVVALWHKKITTEIWSHAYRKAGHNPFSTNAVGDDLYECRDVVGFSMYKSERVYNSFGLTDVKDTIDLELGLGLERCGNLVGSWAGYENKMVNTCHDSIDIEYCELVSNCEHCFGCLGIKHKKFCILNKQYSEQEYWILLDQIKTNMFRDGEYGEFFPYRSSPWAYNTSHAGAQFPLEEMEAKRLGARWYGFTQEKSAPATPIESLPLDLAATDEAMLKQAYRCPVSGRPFLMVKPELKLHQELRVALPRVHPTVRRERRAKQLMPLRLQSRRCQDCQQEVMTRVPPEHPSPLLCETCYEKQILAS